MTITTRILLTFAATVPLWTAAAAAEEPEWRQVTVFAPEDEAVAEAFADADSTWTERWRPDATARAAIASDHHLGPRELVFEFHRGHGKGRDLGWVVVLDEVGLHEPITHLVKVGPDRTVSEVRVLVFRETRGDAIKRPRFLKQFRGKSGRDRLQVGRDVDAVSGATYSSRAVARGVRKALALIDLRYPASP